MLERQLDELLANRRALHRLEAKEVDAAHAFLRTALARGREL